MLTPQLFLQGFRVNVPVIGFIMEKMVSRWVLLTLAFVFSSIVHSEEITLTASINTTKPNDQGHILDWDAGGKLFKKPEVFVSIDGGPFREMFYQYVSSYKNSSGYVYALSLTGAEFPKSLVFLDNDVTRGGNDTIGQGQCNENMEHCEIIHPSGQIAGYFKVEAGGTPLTGFMELNSASLLGFICTLTLKRQKMAAKKLKQHC